MTFTWTISGSVTFNTIASVICTRWEFRFKILLFKQEKCQSVLTAKWYDSGRTMEIRMRNLRNIIFQMFVNRVLTRRNTCSILRHRAASSLWALSSLLVYLFIYSVKSWKFWTLGKKQCFLWLSCFIQNVQSKWRGVEKHYINTSSTIPIEMGCTNIGLWVFMSVLQQYCYQSNATNYFQILQTKHLSQKNPAPAFWVFSEEDLAYPADKIALLDMATLGNTQRTELSSC